MINLAGSFEEQVVLIMLKTKRALLHQCETSALAPLCVHLRLFLVFVSKSLKEAEEIHV